MNEAEARDRFATARVAILATMRPSGGPHLVPITFAVDGSTIWTAVDAKPKQTGTLRRHDNVRANPQVSLLVQHWDEDWSLLWWARADGLAAVTDDPVSVDRALSLLKTKYQQYQGIRLGRPVIEVSVRSWHGWRADGPKARTGQANGTGPHRPPSLP